MSIKCLAWAWGKQLPPLPKLVLLAIADHADDNGYAWPGVSGVAQKCGVSKRTVQRYINLLVNKDVLSVDQRLRPDGSNTSNAYQINMIDRLEGVSACHPPVSQVSPPRVTTDTPLTVIEPSMKHTTTTIPDPDTIPAPHEWPEWFKVLAQEEIPTDSKIRNLLAWAAPYPESLLRDMAYIVVDKWDIYKTKNKSIFSTFQNWYRRDGTTSSIRYDAKNPKKLPIGTTIEIEQHIQSQGLHPSSKEAQAIRDNWEVGHG
jgi:hypothetical protein